MKIASWPGDCSMRGSLYPFTPKVQTRDDTPASEVTTLTNRNDTTLKQTLIFLKIQTPDGAKDVFYQIEHVQML